MINIYIEIALCHVENALLIDILLFLESSLPWYFNGFMIRTKMIFPPSKLCERKCVWSFHTAFTDCYSCQNQKSVVLSQALFPLLAKNGKAKYQEEKVECSMEINFKPLIQRQMIFAMNLWHLIIDWSCLVGAGNLHLEGKTWLLILFLSHSHTLCCGVIGVEVRQAHISSSHADSP